MVDQVIVGILIATLIIGLLVGRETNSINDLAIAKLFLFFAFCNVTTVAMDNSWIPSLYRENSNMQKRWAMLMLEAIDLERARRIIDIGSGDGDITLEIAKQNPKARVIGLDLAQEMVTFANKRHQEQKNLFFIQGDAQNLLFSEQFDAATSFNTLHRVPKPNSAIKEIYKILKPGGSFVAAFPIKGNPIMSEAIAAVDSRDEWKGYFKNPDRKAYQLSELELKKWLYEAGFLVIKAGAKWEDETFESREKFRDLLRATFQHRAYLPADKEIAFFEEIVDEYLKKSPLDQKRRVHFYFNRIEIIAVKPEQSKLVPAKL